MKLTLLSLLLSLSLLTSTAISESITTGNLLPNANDGVDWNSSSTDQINPGGSGYVTNGSTVNGFDITCTGQSNCGYKYSVGGDFEVTGDATVSVDDVGLTTNSITQSMLDNGVTLNSYIDVANCESNQGNCESKGGANDTHTTTIVLKDSDGNTLSTVTQTRNEVTGFQGNCNGYPGTSSTGITTACGQYNDTLIHNDVGANKFDWSWQGVDSNYTNQSRQGPNLLGAKVTMTYNNTEYDPIDDDAQDAIDDIVENLPDIPEDIFEEEFFFEEDYFTWEEDFYFEDNFFEEDFTVYEMPEEFQIIEMPEEFEEMAMEMIEEMPDMEMPADMEDAFTIVSEEMPEMEMTEDMEEEFVEMEMDEEMPEMEEMQEEPAEMEVAEEESVDIETETEEDTMEMPEEEAEEMEVAENEDTMEDPKEDEESNEGSEETLEEESGSEESVSETASNEEETVGDTDVADKGGIKTKNIEVSKNIKIKDVDVGEIKITVNPKDIFKEVVNLDSYSNKDFYQDKGLQYEVNDDFFNQASMIAYNKEIYENVTLVAYIQTDPVAVYKRELEELAIQKAGIMLELKLLRGN